MKLFLMAGIPLGFWDPLRILDWVYKVESVWTQYRNTVFAPAGVDSVQTPMGTISGGEGRTQGRAHRLRAQAHEPGTGPGQHPRGEWARAQRGADGGRRGPGIEDLAKQVQKPSVGH